MIYRFAHFELDTRRELLLGPDGPVALRRQAYRVLLLLLQRAPALVPRDELLDTLWGQEALSPQVVAQTVSELRRSLGEAAQGARLIATRHGRGYAMVATVLADGAAPGASGSAHQGQPSQLPSLLPSSAARPAVGVRVADRSIAGALWLLALQLDPGRLCWSLPGSDTLPPCALTLRVDADGSWRLLDDQGQALRQGRLGPQQGPAAKAVRLWRELHTRLGLVSPDERPSQAPVDAPGRDRLARAAGAWRHGDLAEALQLLGGDGTATTGQGWPGWMQACCLVQSGRPGAARRLLAPLASQAGDARLQLAAEHLLARLESRPVEALGALHALSALCPHDAELRLALLDLQLDSGHRDAAARLLSTMTSGALALHPAALSLRQARWLAGTDPQRGAEAFSEAVQAAERACAVLLADRGRRAWARWHLGRGEPGDALAVLLPARERAHVDGKTELLAAEALMWTGSLADAQAAADCARARFEQGQRHHLARAARVLLLVLAVQQGEHRRALTQAEALQREAVAAEDRSLDAALGTAVGRAYAGLGQLDTAQAQLQAAAAAASRGAQPRQEADALYHLGNVLTLERLKPERAAQAYRAAADLFRRLGDPLGESRCLANMGLLSDRSGRREDAAAAYADALVLVANLKLPRERARISYNAGVNLRDGGKLQAAAERLDEALAHARAGGLPDLAVLAASARVDVALQRAEAVAASDLLQLLDSVARLYPRAGPLPQSNLHCARASLHALQGRLGDAEAELAEAAALRERAGVRAAQIDLQLRQAAVQLARAGDAWATMLALERAHAELLRIAEPKLALSAGLLAIAATLATGDRPAARRGAEAIWQATHRDGTRGQQLLLDWVTAFAADADAGQGPARLRALAPEAAKAGYRLLSTAALRAAEGHAPPWLVPGADGQAWQVQGPAALFC